MRRRGSRIGVAVFGVLVVAGGVAAVRRGGRVVPPPVTLVAGGDVMFARGIALVMSRTSTPGLLLDVRADLRADEIAFVNLECALARVHGTVPKMIAFRAAPECATLLRQSGLDVVSLANNHIIDCGRGGMQETFRALRLAGVRWCGAGETRAASEQPCVIRVNGRRVAFVAFSQFFPEFHGPPGVPAFVHANEPDVRRIVAAARGVADHVVASFHWGAEYAEQPIPLQRTLALAAAQAGADVILGHHPHVLQGLELLPPARTGRATHVLVAYSLGNFLFDQTLPGTRESMLLRVTLGRAGVLAAQVRPIEIIRGRPIPARPTPGAAILRRMARLSEHLGTALDGDALVVAHAP